MVATRARRASGEGTPRAAAPRRVSTRSTSPAPKKPAARARSPARKSSKNLKAPPAELSPYDMPPLEKFLRCVLLPLFLLVPCPLLVAVLAFATNNEHVTPSIDGLASYVSENGVGGLIKDSFDYVGIFGTAEAWKLLGYFNLAALVLYYVPGPTKEGPRTATGHVPKYVDNGVAHCVLSSLLFVGGAYLGLYDAGILYDVFPGTIGALNAFGLVFCVFLYVKGLYAPSTADCGKSGGGFIFDYYWGTELYPRVFDIDIKKFVNCRFAMTYWQLAGLSFAYKSYTLHGRWDPGLVLAAVSQYLYLVKFFAWEIGYMRSIDIIVDRAGFYETWGCLVWVPCVYTLHSRCGVRAPTQLSWLGASIIFGVGLLGVGLNFWADAQRMRFREANGKCKVWGRKPVYIKTKYVTADPATGALTEHSSLLLASGWWGVARHLQYSFELTAAWSWGLLANPLVNGPLPLFYAAFLTILLIHRAHRDEEKCLKKYGAYYEDYMARVKYRIVPGVY